MWRRFELAVAPPWLVQPLIFLGFTFLVTKPLGFGDQWTFYVLALGLAVGLGWFAQNRYELTVLEREAGNTVMRMAVRRSATFEAGESASSRPAPDAANL